MNLAEILRPPLWAFARRSHREYLVVSYESEPAAIRAVLPEPLEPGGVNIVRVEFVVLRAPDGGCAVEVDVVIPAWLNDTAVDFLAHRWIDGYARAHPKLIALADTLAGIVECAGQAIASATMDNGHTAYSTTAVARQLGRPRVSLRRAADIDGRCAMAQLVESRVAHVRVRDASAGAAQLHLGRDALAPSRALPVSRVLGGLHFVADVTPAGSRVVHDYAQNERAHSGVLRAGSRSRGADAATVAAIH